ncbi:UNVERIFIED_ORG: hypothetical protein B2H98_16330 [Clostridium botulinum]|uniref:Uncharacterized protein n=1 Tax=Clostridium botulinum TaxID=1491 RepID=A0A6B4MYL8_CLOBO|nr:hypothetical protein [Clostridium botulinum]ACD52996.1 hypothetical protein CLH_0499 [Clostridium botulinum E3 str. Alaska E43]AJF28552.1 hypothetical protein ST13_02360 [Clostridium botulinum]AJF31613.1 hypothetical protein ST12_02360 [Clostridium botulinum]EES49147.1 hypothetical protein CLO_3275 [Clostridium botulinum E1 str. 'BoNT E Beluga']MBN1034366.1 hypothetical protein [Clostridium botulinum]
MKRILTIIFMCFALLMNIYLIFYWQPNKDTKAIINKNNDSISVLSYSKSIYTVSKDNIINILSEDDKKDLTRIVYKLSTSDIGRVKEAFNLEDENKGVITAFKVFETRLSTQDYKKIRGIFSKFIDIDYLDSNLIK